MLNIIYDYGQNVLLLFGYLFVTLGTCYICDIFLVSKLIRMCEVQETVMRSNKTIIASQQEEISHRNAIITGNDEIIALQKREIAHIKNIIDEYKQVMSVIINAYNANTFIRDS